MDLSISTAVVDDAAAIASLRTAVADKLTDEFGPGHWSSRMTEFGALRVINTSRVLVARHSTGVVGALRLTTKKPWAIDPNYFESVRRPLYLVDMAVEPAFQRQGVGRRLLEAAKEVAGAWPADAIRLDAYDGPAGAGPFYSKCGFRQVGRVTYRGVLLLYFESVL